MPLFGKKKYASVTVRKRDMPNGLWLKCPACNEIIYKKELDEKFGVCPKCGHHFPLPPPERIRWLADEGTFEEWDAGLRSRDPLNFKAGMSYPDKLAENMKKTGHPEAVRCGRIRLQGKPVAIGVMDFGFLGGSMGSVVGEKVTRLFEQATEQNLPVVLVCASGGARMYEGMFSLMQMAKTSGAVARHAARKLAYIPVLTHPTMAGVMASFATQGDVILAEPNALIGFAGPRVIKETTQQDIPKGFQLSEFLLEHGLLDAVVPRDQLRARIVLLLDYLSGQPDAAPASP